MWIVRLNCYVFVKIFKQEKSPKKLNILLIAHSPKFNWLQLFFWRSHQFNITNKCYFLYLFILFQKFILNNWEINFHTFLCTFWNWFYFLIVYTTLWYHIHFRMNICMEKWKHLKFGIDLNSEIESHLSH